MVVVGFEIFIISLSHMLEKTEGTTKNGHIIVNRVFTTIAFLSNLIV